MAGALRWYFPKQPAAANQQEAIMHVAGMDAHATYVVVAIVSNDGALVRQPVRISNARPTYYCHPEEEAADRTLPFTPHLMSQCDREGPYRQSQCRERGAGQPRVLSVDVVAYELPRRIKARFQDVQRLRRRSRRLRLH